jgi:DNA helicase-2/ATP-dependent DNA helicase PcrA
VTATSYTESQAAAIGAPEQNLQIIAGAGSGKTQVMAARVAELLSRESNTPTSIVAFTFTDKAAAELKDRIYQLVREVHGDLTGMAEMFVGTMHAYALNLLQSQLYRFLKFSVLTDVQTRLFIDRNSNKSGLTSVPVRTGPSTGQKLKRGIDSRLYIQLLGILREDDVDWDEVPAEVSEALAAYRSLLEQHRYLDYSEILLAAVEALEGDDQQDQPLRSFIQQNVRHVIVDEFQDVNPLQERLIRTLHDLGAVVSIVGDDDQTIFQWRGSDIEGILTFDERYDDVQRVTLDDNFRSSPGVVDVGRRVAQRNDPNRLDKHMVAAGHQTFDRGDILALSFADPAEEAEWIAAQIKELRGVQFRDGPESEPRGIAWSDCAVLLRSVARSAEPIVEALKAGGIPHVVGGLNNLFEAPEITAAAVLFEYVAGAVSPADVVDAWLVADLGLSRKVLEGAIKVLDDARDFSKGERWGSYNIQRTFLSFLEAVDFREESVPATSAGASRGEVVLFNLGKFSQLISDFEQINFQSDPARKYESFVWWLRRDAPDFYEEGGADAAYATPDAVQILTVHRAKGLQWPVVFVPALQRNRFPSRRQGGRNAWHVLPRAAVAKPERYDGGEADETRLFYVAATRSQKYLYFTYAPGDSKQYRQPSALFTAVTSYPPVLTKPAKQELIRATPVPLHETPEVTLSFSELKYLFECPYQFKLRFLYGFNPPIHEALGYGKSVHDCMAEIHKRAMGGELADPAEAPSLVDQHLHVPFAYPQLRDDLKRAAVDAVTRYLEANQDELRRTEYAEKEIELVVSPGITVNGRVDLIRRLDTDEISIVDFKSTERAQDEDVTRQQLHVYAMGYRELTGTSADLIEVLNLDERGKSTREVVDDHLLGETTAMIRDAGEAIRSNVLRRVEHWCDTCNRCDLAGICRTREA